MGLILDSSLLIADERGRFDMPGFLRQISGVQPVMAAITASELLHHDDRAAKTLAAAKPGQVHSPGLFKSLLDPCVFQSHGWSTTR